MKFKLLLYSYSIAKNSYKMLVSNIKVVCVSGYSLRKSGSINFYNIVVRVLSFDSIGAKLEIVILFVSKSVGPCSFIVFIV